MSESIDNEDSREDWLQLASDVLSVVAAVVGVILVVMVAVSMPKERPGDLLDRGSGTQHSQHVQAR